MNTFLTRILNALCSVLLTQEEQNTYPQIYPNYYFSVRYFVLFEESSPKIAVNSL